MRLRPKNQFPPLKKSDIPSDNGGNMLTRSLTFYTLLVVDAVLVANVLLTLARGLS